MKTGEHKTKRGHKTKRAQTKRGQTNKTRTNKQSNKQNKNKQNEDTKRSENTKENNKIRRHTKRDHKRTWKYGHKTRTQQWTKEIEDTETRGHETHDQRHGNRKMQRAEDRNARARTNTAREDRKLEDKVKGSRDTWTLPPKFSVLAHVLAEASKRRLATQGF